MSARRATAAIPRCRPTVSTCSWRGAEPRDGRFLHCSRTCAAPSFSGTPPVTRPQRFLNRMILFLGAVCVVCALIWPALYNAFLGNPALNGIILGATLVGIVYIFRQVLMLTPNVAWIENWRRNQAAAAREPAPRLLTPMATMLGERKGSR